MNLPVDGASWVARLHTRRLSWGERRALRRWLGASSEHARDLLRAETVWRLSGALGREEEVVAELSRIPLQDSADALTGSTRRLLVWRWAVAGVAVGAVAGLVWLALASRPQWFETAPGEQRVVTLADGSTVAINTASRISVAFDEKERLIRLESGEALFQVAHDPARPFVVQAGAGRVRAVGTRFNVLLEAGAMTVSVLEGRVELSSPGAAERLLDAGESAALEHSGHLVAADPERASAERIAAWREGKLRFDEWSVERAVQEHNRYAAKPIRIATQDVGGRLVSGTFRIGDTPALLEALEHLLGVEATEAGDEWVLENRSE